MFAGHRTPAIDFTPRNQISGNGTDLTVGINNFQEGEFDQYLSEDRSTIQTTCHNRSGNNIPPPPPYDPAQPPDAGPSTSHSTWTNDSCGISSGTCSTSVEELQRIPNSQSSNDSPINLSPDSHENSTITNHQQHASQSFQNGNNLTANSELNSESKIDTIPQYQRQQRYNYELHMARYGYHQNVHDIPSEASLDYTAAATVHSQQYYPQLSNPYQCMTAGMRTMYSMYHQ